MHLALMISIMLKIKRSHLEFLSIITLLEIPILLAFKWMLGDYREPRFNVWPVTEWLINYQGGFVRRGLVGEILLRLSDPFSGILPNLYRLTLLSYVLYVAIFFAVYFSAKIRRYRVLLIALLIQGGIYHMGISADFYTRKENLFLILFGSICLLYIKSTQHLGKRKDYYLMSLTVLAMIFGPVMVLIHEAYFFMSMPMTALLMWIACKENPTCRFLRLGLAAYILECAILFIVCSLHHGDVVLAQTVWDSLPWIDRLKLSPAAPYSQFAAISSIGWGLGQHLSTIYGVFISGGVYLWAFFVLGNGLSLSYLATQIYPASTEDCPKRIYGLLIAGLLMSSGMLLIAADWGRWIAFISNQLILLIFALNCSILAKQPEKSAFFLFLIEKLGKWVKINLNGLFWGSLLYGLAFQMPECCVQYPNIFAFQSLFR